MGRRGGGGGSGAASNAKEMRVFLQHRMWREHWYVLVGAAVVVVALFAGFFLRFSTAEDHVHRLELSDASRVFQSGDPWLVLCAQPDDVLPEAFDDVAGRLVGRARVGVFDCTQPLPWSKKNVWATYALRRGVTATAFTVANGDKPKQIHGLDLRSSRALSKRAIVQTKKMLVQVRSTAQLETRCLDKDACVFVLRGRKLEPYEKRWLTELAQQRRAVGFVWADSKELKLSIDSLLPPAVEGEHRLVLFRRKPGSSDEKRAQLQAKAYRGAVFDPVPVGMFLDEYLDGDAAMKQLTKKPKLINLKGTEGSKRRPRKSKQGEQNTEEQQSPPEVEDVANDADDSDESEEEVVDLDDE